MVTEKTKTRQRLGGHGEAMLMAFKYAEGGKEAVFEAFPELTPEFLTKKMIECGLEPKPQKPRLNETDKQTVGMYIDAFTKIAEPQRSLSIRYMIGELQALLPKNPRKAE